VRWWGERGGENGWWGVDSWGAEGGHVGFGVDGGGELVVLVDRPAGAGTQCGFVVVCRLVLWRCHRRRWFDS
jgi:hypothetical protein